MEYKKITAKMRKFLGTNYLTPLGIVTDARVSDILLRDNNEPSSVYKKKNNTEHDEKRFNDKKDKK